jgi:hypothetical protein
MHKIIKYKSDNWPKNVSIIKINSVNTGNKFKNLIKYAKPFIMRTKCSKTKWIKWISVLNKNINQRNKKIQNFNNKSKSGKLDIKHQKKVKQNN